MERTYKVEDVLALMTGMAANKVALLEMPGLKLALSPERVSGTAAAGGINVPQPTSADAIRAVQAARIEAARQAESKLAQSQQRTANARRKAASGIGGGLGKHVDNVFKAAVESGTKDNG